MIAKTTTIRKLIREAWRNGVLSVSCLRGQMKISGGHWIYLRKEGRIPKKLAAAIIELTGELPEEGCGYTAGPGGNQMMLSYASLFQAGTRQEKDGTVETVSERHQIYHDYAALFQAGIPQEKGSPLTKTALMAAHGSKRYRIFQEYAGGIRAVNEIFLEAVDGAVPEDGETEPEGPFTGTGHSIYWETNAEILVAMEVKLDDLLGEVVKNALEGENLPT